jgi:hypothetical protein
MPPLTASRRVFLGACAGAAALRAASPRPAVRFAFEGSLANEGSWGGALRVTGAASSPLSSGVADLTGAWAGRLLFEDARLAGLGAFTVAASFNPLRLGRDMTVLGRAGAWLIRVRSNGVLTFVTYYKSNATQSADLTLIAQPDSWYEVAASFDPARGRVEAFCHQVGDPAPPATASFRLVSGTFGPATKPADSLELGAGFYGWLDNVLLYDRAFSTEELAALLHAAPPSPARRFGPWESQICPLSRDPSVALPRRSDVPMSSRWWHPRGAADPHDTLRDLRAFHATRLEWIYDRDPAHIRHVSDGGILFCATVNATDSTPGRPYSVHDFDGGVVTFPWMISWTQSDGRPPGAACVNNPAYRAQLLDQIATLTASGARAIQYDDWASNVSLMSSTGECLCEHCRRKFAAWLRAHASDADLARWGVADVAHFDYRDFLRTSRGVHSAAEFSTWRRKNAADPLQHAYAEFQVASVRENLAALKAVLAPRSGAVRPAITVNTHFTSPSLQSRALLAGDIADYFVGEGGDSTLTGLFVNAKIAEALGRLSILSPFPYKPEITRSEIALSYALGQLCLVPYDIWMRTTDLPRYFGAPQQYADLFAFVRAHAALFDACETVATVGLAIDPARPEPPRFRTWVRALAGSNVPFVLLFPHTKARVRTTVDLSSDPTPEFLREHAVMDVEAPGVVATLRARTGAGKCAALHLVNRNFDLLSRVAPLTSFGVRLLSTGFWEGIRRAELLTPGSAPRPLELQSFARGLRVVVPELRSWAVLRLTP